MRGLLVSVLLLWALHGAAEAQQKWALLIGVNEYPVEQWKLKGCINDVSMTKELLTTKFGFPPENVKVLTDTAATADNIRQAIEDWLIARPHPGDIVYFHFSGHGAQMPDQDDEEEDGMDEFLCPVNLHPSDHKTLVTDDELHAYFARIPTQNVTIITDCCHSGSGTRDLTLNRNRSIDPSDLEHFALVKGKDGVTRAVIMSPAPGAAQPKQETPPPPAVFLPKNQEHSQGSVDEGNTQQVHISGCRDDQTSADALIRDGFSAGALSYYWTENLRNAPPDISYRDLVERVRRDLKANKYSQIPQINGAADRPIFGARIVGVPSVPFVLVQAVEGSKVTLSAGLAQQVTEGSVYAVYPEGETTFQGEGLGRIQVAQVFPTYAEASVLGEVTVRPGYRAKKVLQKQEIHKLQLLLEGAGDAVQEAVKSSLASLEFVEVVDPGKHFHQRLQLSQTATGLQAALTIDGVAGPAAAAADAAGLVAELRPQLESSYAIQYLSNLVNDHPPFKVEVWAQKASGGGRDAVVEELADAPDEKYVQARLGDVLRFHFRTAEDCYLTMVNVGTSGKVNVLFPNKLFPEGRVQAGKEYRTRSYKGDPDAEIPLTIRMDPNGKAGREFVQIIASKKPLNLSTLTAQEGSRFVQQITQNLAVEGGGGSLLPTDGWATDYLFVETHE